MTAPREEVVVTVGDHTYRHDGAVWRLIGGARNPVCGPRISALLDRLAEAEETHAAMRDECSALRLDLRAALGERDEARRDRDDAKQLAGDAFREGWDCGDWQDGRDNVSARLYDWNHSLAKRALDAAQATGREG
jgi:hypothetical protein